MIHERQFVSTTVREVIANSFLSKFAATRLRSVHREIAHHATTIIGLAPIFLDPGRCSDVMQPMAIPSVGGMSVALITLFVIPCCYCLVCHEESWLSRTDSPAMSIADR